jgi:AcrR family transcriptional regulator
LTKKAASERKTRGLDVTVATQRRRQIVEAARACIAEEGVDKLTLRKVAERAQVSHATIAYYFNTRKELIDSAFLEISEEFMGELRQRQLVYGPQDLAELVESFLDPGRPSSRFVVQMIDAGLRDLQLRGTHDEFLAWGRDRIEKSIRVGIETGHYRADVEPKLAAALIHTVLIWWEAELAADATTREMALEVGRLAIRLLEQKQAGKPSGRRQANSGKAGSRNGQHDQLQGLKSPTDLFEASLLNDPRLSPQAATTLADTFKKLYWLAIGMPEAERSD